MIENDPLVCKQLGHDYSRSKTIGYDKRGRRIRTFYCADCGAIRPKKVVVKDEAERE